MSTEINKFVVALAGAVAEAVSLGLLPDPAKPWSAVIIGFLAAMGVYAVPNKPTVTNG